MEYLVAGDQGIQLQVKLTRNNDGSAVDLTGSTTVMRIRKKGTTTVLSTITNSSSGSDLTSGIAVFEFSASDLNVDAGKYEGEVEATLATGEKSTVYEIIEFYIRADFD